MGKAATLLLVALLAGLGPVEAQIDPGKPETGRFGNPTVIAANMRGYIYGVVKRVEAGELVLDKTEFGDNQPFKLEAKTKFTRDGKPSQLADLKAGDKVWVQIKREKKTGEMIAKKVVVGLDPTGAPE